MTEFRECQLRDIVCFGNGKARPKAEGNIPVYGGNGILEYADQFNYDGETIIIGRVGAYCGSVFYENRPIWISDNALAAKPKGSNSTKYLYYLLKLSDLNQHAEGSSHPLITQTLLNSVEVMYCEDVIIQKAIAEVLSSLDDKIDLLTRQNKTLEDLAQTYFRKWFVEDASEEWEVARLGDILESIESGSRPKGGIDPELVNGVPSIGAESINGLGVYDFSKTKYVTRDFFNNMRRGVVKSHDVLVYKDGAYVGRKGMFGNDFPFAEFAVNEHVFILRSNEKAGQIFLYFLLQEEELAQLNSNSAQPGLNQQAMKAYEIALPPKKLINDFETFAEPLIDKIFENAKQMRTLRKLRDTLLPKLISGEVRVKQ